MIRHKEATIWTQNVKTIPKKIKLKQPIDITCCKTNQSILGRTDTGLYKTVTASKQLRASFRKQKNIQPNCLNIQFTQHQYTKRRHTSKKRNEKQ